MDTISKYTVRIILILFLQFLGKNLYAQSNVDSINFDFPSLEEFAYPFKNLNYISPRYEQVKNRDGSRYRNYILRTVFTIPDLPIHFRVELPYSTYNSSAVEKNGLGDISLRSVFVFHQKKRLLAGFALKTIFPTAKDAHLGAGDFQLNPDIGFLNVFPRSMGSIGLSAEYLFSVGKNKFGNPETSVFGISPTLDYWGKNMQIGYYPTYTYNFKTKQWNFPFDVELGWKIYKSIWARIELILPTQKYDTNSYECLVKLRHDF